MIDVRYTTRVPQCRTGMFARSLLMRIGADQSDQSAITVSSSAAVNVLQCKPLALLTAEHGVFPMITTATTSHTS